VFNDVDICAQVLENCAAQNVNLKVIYQAEFGEVSDFDRNVTQMVPVETGSTSFFPVLPGGVLGIQTFEAQLVPAGGRPQGL
jgi:acyl-CoA synthetase (NDP forming)